jgi:hypothetical protein
MLLAGLVPAAAFAEDTVISKISMIGDEPAEGYKVGDFDFDLGNLKYAVSVYRATWYDYWKKEELSPGDEFKPGHSYYLDLVLKASDGYVFSMDKDPNSDTNGQYDVSVKYNTNTYNNIEVDGGGGQKYLYVKLYWPSLPKEQIYDVYITMPEPEARMNAYYDAEDKITTEDKYVYYVQGVSWYLGKDVKTASNLYFDGLTDYNVRLQILSGNDYEFAPGCNVWLNGKQLESVTDLGKTTLVAYYFFTTGPDKDMAKATIQIAEPAVGHPASYVDQTDAATEHYKTYQYSIAGRYIYNGIYWYDETDKKYLDESSVFEAGHRYTVRLAKKADSGYQWTFNGDYTINGKNANSGIMAEVAENKDHHILHMWYTFPEVKAKEPEKKVVNSVSMTWNNAETDKKPDYEVIKAGVGYHIDTDYSDNGAVKGVAWAEVSSKDINSIVKILSPNDTFEGGKTYMTAVVLKADDGYIFDEKFASDFSKAQLHNDNADFVLLEDDKQTMYVYQYSGPLEEKVKLTPINEISITIAEPKLGESPAYLYACGSDLYSQIMVTDETYTNGMAWVEFKSKPASLYDIKMENVAAMLTPNDKFEAGKSYGFAAVLAAAPGYGFPEGYIPAKVNGETAVSEPMNEQAAICMYAFDYLKETAPAKLTSIKITQGPDKTEYKDGESFDPSGMIVTAVYDDKSEKAVSGYTFTPSGKLAESSKTVTVSYTEGNVTKTAEVDITVKKAVLDYIKISKAPTKKEYKAGDEFDPEGMVITAVYDDKTEKAVDNYTYTPYGKLTIEDKNIKISYTEGNVTKIVNQKISVTKAKTPESLEITKQPDKTEYKEGESFKPAGMVVTVTYTDKTTAEVENYNYEPSGKLAESDKFVTITYTENQVTRTADVPIKVTKQVAMVNPFTDVKDSDYYYDAVLWAYYHEPQITDGTSKNHFSPNATCTRGQVVTFLWRAAGCPEPKSTENPFVDVKESDYFYKPVLWAVEQKITQGANADGTKFVPYQTCSTMHIATFLYRSIHFGADGWGDVAKNWVKSNGLADNTGLEIKIGEDCPRSAVVTFLYRYYEGK